MKQGYIHLSKRGRAVCEFVELSARHDVEKIRAGTIPGRTIPKKLVDELRTRYSQLSEQEKAAIVDLRSAPVRLSSGEDKHIRWSQWVEQHLKQFPDDAIHLYFLTSSFGGGITRRSTHVMNTCGLRDYDWRMEHHD